MHSSKHSESSMSNSSKTRSENTVRKWSHPQCTLPKCQRIECFYPIYSTVSVDDNYKRRMNGSAHIARLSRLPPVPCREDFAEFAQRYFHVTGVAAEVGVFQADFSVHNLRHWKGEYHAVDAWAHRPDDPFDKNFRDPLTNERNLDIRLGVHRCVAY